MKDRVFSDSPVIVGKTGIIVVAFVTLIISVTLYFLISFIYKRVDAVVDSSQSQRSELIFTVKSINFRLFLKRSVVIFLCWMPYLIIRFPGNLDSDTLWQIMQTKGLVTPSDHHPWFDTLIFSLFWQLGDILHNHLWSVLLFALIQMISSALVFAIVFSYLDFLKINERLILFCLIFVCVFPTIPMYAQTMAKDMIFAWIWLLFLVCYAEIGRTQGEVLLDNAFSAIFMLDITLMMLTKKTGIYLLLISGFAMFLYIKRKIRFLVLVGSSVAVFSILWSSLLLPSLGIAKGESREMLSLPSQQVAYYIKAHKEEMTDHDWNVLKEVYNSPETMGESYMPSRADSSKDRWREDSTLEEKKDFIVWYFSSFVKHPADYVFSAGAITLPLYYPDTSTEGNESLLFYLDNLASSEVGDSALENTLIWYSQGRASQEDINDLMQGSYRYPSVARMSDEFDSLYLNISGAFSLFFSKVLYVFWIPLLATAYAFRKKNRLNAVLLIPFWVTLLTLLAGPIALPRYFAPVIFSLPILLGMLGSPRSVTK
ncbi:DUF6020 family protein [Bifidobacterium tissieri]|uniref:DUF6020 family protein n=1 Tax=Bifidobacterium tissieri TaxID=1630162 RepID=UPI001239ED89|nr:DUF6020 family protein [Bifidobacterium tissieri]KAA8830637.1 hypothetical protein EM849_09210 [Bifidobacterium tissieri]